MKALVSPNEKIYSYDGTELGSRIADVRQNEYDVALPLFWIDCPDTCVAYQVYYLNGKLYDRPSPLPPPEPEPVIPPEQ
jgi:hypothetical protein